MFDFIVVAARGIAILLPEPSEEFRGFQKRVWQLAEGGAPMDISHTDEAQCPHLWFPKIVREVIVRDSDLGDGGRYWLNAPGW